MLQAFLRGLVAGYGIAIPIGAISVMILDASIRRGFRHGFAAGAGAASADLFYATIAAGAGGVIGPLLAPMAFPLRVASGIVLTLIALHGFRSLLRSRAAIAEPEAKSQARGTFARFLALTLVNPLTIVYFAALVLANSSRPLTAIELSTFVAGAFVASFSWQTLLALLGAWAHLSAGETFRRLSGVFGNLVILGFGIVTLLKAG